MTLRLQIIHLVRFRLECAFNVCIVEVEGRAIHPIRLKTTPRAQQKREKQGKRLEDKSGTLGLLVTTKLEVLASLESELRMISI